MLGVSPSLPKPDDDNDDWETDADFVNDVTEEEQRWGSKTVAGSGRTGGAIELVIQRWILFGFTLQFATKTVLLFFGIEL